MKKSTSRFAPKNHQASLGFTIVELLIVIVVIAILAAISIVAFSGIQARARDTQRMSDIASIKQLLMLYKTDHGAYPTKVPNPGSSNWEVSTDPGFLSSLSDYTSNVFEAPGQTSSIDNAYWYNNFAADTYCPAEFGAFAVLWITGMEAQGEGITKDACPGGTLLPAEHNEYAEYLY